MKAITIYQPYATLIAIGAKTLETRSRRTHFRGALAIHAGKKIDLRACECEPIKSVLRSYGYTVDNLPTGAIIAVANLSDCATITNSSLNEDKVTLNFVSGKKSFLEGDSLEYMAGDYSQGRYAFELSDVKQLKDPIIAKGQQGMWNFYGQVG